MLTRTSNARVRAAKIAITSFSIGALLCLIIPSLASAATVQRNASYGGATAAKEPVIADAICRTGCIGLRRAVIGGTIQITGRDLAEVTTVTFAGPGKRLRAPVSSAGPSTVVVAVPAGARAGRLVARDDYGNRSQPSPKRLAFEAPGALRASGPLQVTSAEAAPRRAYFFGARKPRLDYVVRAAAEAVDLRIDVIGEPSGEIVRSYFRRQVPTNAGQRLRWDGRSNAGTPARGGRYSFRIATRNGQVAQLSRRVKRQAARSSDAGNPLSFQLFGFTFPVRSRVSFGDGLGAGRGHQGQDLLTRCGRKVVAARGGTVIYKGDMSGAAGNYVVISGRSTGLDFAYMHLLRPVDLEVGDTVRTGQRIGLVGATGRASTCHLHFEVWGAPGWYKGGSPVSPTSMLRRWYRQ